MPYIFRIKWRHELPSLYFEWTCHSEDLKIPNKDLNRVQRKSNRHSSFRGFMNNKKEDLNMQGPAESKPSNQKVVVFFYLKAEFSTVSKDIYKYIYMSLDTVEKLTGDLQITSSRLSIQPMNFCNGSIQTYMQCMVRETCRRSVCFLVASIR